MRKRLAIALGLLVAGCGGKSPGPTTVPEETGGDDGDPNADVVTLTQLTMGDVACYVNFTRADGSEGDFRGDFDLCEGGPKDATALIGTQVTITTEHQEMQSANCEGDPDCTETEEVDLAVAITPAP